MTMHHYVQSVCALLSAAPKDGDGNCLRIRPEAGRARAIAYLTAERNAAAAEVRSLEPRTAPQLLNFSAPMQMLILTELLLAEPDKPVDIRALNLVQGRGPYVAQRIEEAAKDLIAMAPRLLEAVRL
jgi:hypothetical protein